MPGIKTGAPFLPPHHPQYPAARQAGDSAARATSTPPCCLWPKWCWPEHLLPGQRW